MTSLRRLAANRRVNSCGRRREFFGCRSSVESGMTKLAKPEIILRDIPANSGVEARYRKALQLLLRDMAADIRKRLKKAYQPTKERLAMDDDPVITLRTLMRQLARRWTARFDKLSKEIAEEFATRSQSDFDFAFRKRLREAGFTVQFRPTEHMLSSYRAVVAENVSLIKSVPQQFLKDVEGAVWRSALKGGAAYELSKEIREKYGISARRAAFIASDQNAKARTTFEQSRRAELGITTAVWKHSHAGRKPRPTHVAMDGKKFSIAKGMFDPAEQAFIQPGTLPRCRCTSRAVI
jgi:uncharacterized protein with gpF-like domain